jgi:cellulose synthase/poly-beta-1,6-N-acetylglucosamine synthase-like glycosyltransferase
MDHGLDENLRPLLAQDYPNYEVVFVVESPDDPACTTIQNLMRDAGRVPVRMAVAGKATDTGQKIHNLLAGVAKLPDDVEILAFVDSDARPHPAWLRLLVQRLDSEGAAAATGYRWFIPTKISLATLMQYSVNACAAVMYRADSRGLVWGGSWAIRRDKFEACGLREAWGGTLSDDLMAARVLKQNKLRVEFEPACMLASPLALSTGQMLEFIRRQYVIGRVYALRTWLIGFASIVGSAAMFWGSLTGAFYGAATGASWAWAPLTFCILWYAISVTRGALRGATARVYFRDRGHQLHTACLFDTYAGPLVALVNAGLMIASAVGTQITWRGNTYRMFQGGRIQLLRRVETPAPAEVNERIVRVDPPGPVFDMFHAQPKQTNTKAM